MDGDQDRIKELLDAEVRNSPGKSWAKGHPNEWRGYRDWLLKEYGADIDAIKEAIHRQFPDRRTRREVEKRLDGEIENPRCKDWAEAHPTPWRRLRRELVREYGADIDAIKEAVDRQFPDRQAMKEAEKAERAELRATVFRADGKPFSERVTANRIREIVREREWKQKAPQAAEVVEPPLAQWLRGLPEFRDSSAARIQEVSRELTEFVSSSQGWTR